MRRHWTQPLSTVVVGTLALSGCRDVTAPPSLKVPAPARSTSYSDAPAAINRPQEVRCFLTITTYEPLGYTSYAVNVPFSASVAAAGGRTRLYLYRELSSSGRLARAANCEIPATAGAVAFANLVFKVPASARIRTQGLQLGASSAAGGVQYTSGVTLPAIEVTVTPVDQSPSGGSECSASCTGPSGTGSGGGGGTWTAGEPTGNPLAAGPGVWVACVGGVLGLAGISIFDTVELDQYHSDVDKMNQAYSEWQAAQALGDVAAASAAYQKYADLSQDVKRDAWTLGGGVLVTTGAVLGAGALCSPSVLFPTP